MDFFQAKTWELSRGSIQGFCVRQRISLSASAIIHHPPATASCLLAPDYHPQLQSLLAFTSKSLLAFSSKSRLWCETFFMPTLCDVSSDSKSALIDHVNWISKAVRFKVPLFTTHTHTSFPSVYIGGFYSSSLSRACVDRRNASRKVFARHEEEGFQQAAGNVKWMALWRQTSKYHTATLVIDHPRHSMHFFHPTHLVFMAPNSQDT